MEYEVAGRKVQVADLGTLGQVGDTNPVADRRTASFRDVLENHLGDP